MVNIAVLLTCFNRKALTLRCLQHLACQEGSEHFALDIYLVDDGCTDGTGNAVREQFPDVHVIQGNGELFWNGGMRVAWQEALKTQHDFFLWVNDDISIYPFAVKKLLDDYNNLVNQQLNPGALAGTLVDPASTQLTYGGRKTNSKFNPLNTLLVIPGNTPLPCDFINGNLVLVPGHAVNNVGILNGIYKHGYGDYDYSCRLRKAGFSCWVASGILGECTTNLRDFGQEPDKSIAVHMQELRQLERLFPYRDHMHFVKYCSGKFWPVWWVKGWLRGNLPLIWVLLTRY